MTTPSEAAMAAAAEAQLEIEDQRWPKRLERGIGCETGKLHLLKYSECMSRSYLFDSHVNAF